MAHVVTRFAPRPPAGSVGGARTALFCYAFAKREGGSLLLRIEDTDQRSSEDFTRGILQDMAWLGIAWDGARRTPTHAASSSGRPRSVAPFEQSRRLDLYDRYIDRLIDEGRPTPPSRSPRSWRPQAAIARKELYRYDRAALDVPADERARRGGEPHALLCPDEEVLVVDEVLERSASGPARSTISSSGRPTGSRRTTSAW